MLFYLLNTDLEIINVIDAYKSYIWTNRFYEPGDFELCLPAEKHYMETIKHGCMLIREGHLSNAMIVYHVEIQSDIETGDMLIVKGYCLKSLLDRRIIWDQTNLKGNVEVAMRKLITENVISPKIEARKIPFFELGELKGFTKTLSAQFTGKNLGEALTELCKSYEYGYDVLLDLNRKKFSFVVLEGTNRSYTQSKNPYVVFSDDYENLLSSNYSMNTYGYKNVAKVAGEGEGLARRYVSIGSAEGLDRFETYVDARDLSSNEGAISDSEYTSILLERGLEKISEFGISESVDGEVEKNYNFTLGKDYFLGDTIQLITGYGIRMSPTIVEIIESEDESSSDVVIKFGTLTEVDSSNSSGGSGSGGGGTGGGTSYIQPTIKVVDIVGGAKITCTDKDGTTEAIVYDGAKGDKGDDGIGIQSITQTTTSSASGGNNVITCILTDGTRSTFTIKNGEKGDPGEPGSSASATKIVNKTLYQLMQQNSAIKVMYKDASASAFSQLTQGSNQNVNVSANSYLQYCVKFPEELFSKIIGVSMMQNYLFMNNNIYNTYPINGENYVYYTITNPTSSAVQFAPSMMIVTMVE